MKKRRPNRRTANKELVFNRWLVKGSPATSIMAWSLLGMSLGSVDATTEGLNEVFGVVGDCCFSSDDAGDVWIGFTEGVDGEGVVGTDGEMLADVLVPDGEGEEGCFGIVVCAAVVEVVVVLVVVEEGLGLVVVGLGVVVVVDVMAGVVVIASSGTASVLLAFTVGVVCRSVAAIVVELSGKVVGFVVLEVLVVRTLGLVGDGCVTVIEGVVPEDSLGSGDLSV